jgi:hypothetical protein
VVGFSVSCAVLARAASKGVSGRETSTIKID